MDLPVELKLKIISYLSLREIAKAASVNRIFSQHNEIIRQTALQRLQKVIDKNKSDFDNRKLLIKEAKANEDAAIVLFFGNSFDFFLNVSYQSGSAIGVGSATQQYCMEYGKVVFSVATQHPKEKKVIYNLAWKNLIQNKNFAEIKDIRVIYTVFSNILLRTNTLNISHFHMLKELISMCKPISAVEQSAALKR